MNIFVTGSASFDLENKVGEPLTGRQVPLRMFPVSVGEARSSANDFELRGRLGEYLVYGMYPEVLTADTAAKKKLILNEVVSAYLLKDILELERIKKPKLLLDLLTLIALQLGKEVSLNELSAKLSVNINTVSRYLDLLEKCFVIYNLRGFSRHLRNEVTKKSKYYFYDCGIRNALLSNFNDIAKRDDIGGLFENFIVIERLKKRTYDNIFGRDYFWRTWEQNEIDLIEDYDGILHTYEIKFSPKKHPAAPVKFTEAYTGSTFEVINSGNFTDYL